MKTLLISTSADLALAGKVRALRATDNEMVPIYMKMGRSTVIRFREKPQKVVVGNQNYFNIEFIGKDVTLQPQAIVTSNLFVYTKNHTYGFLLRVGEHGGYDDLVKVEWRSLPLNFKTKRNPKAKHMPPRDIGLALKGRLLLKLERVEKASTKGLYFMDLLLKNVSLASIDTSRVSLFVTAKGKDFPFKALSKTKAFPKGPLQGGGFSFL